MLGLGRAAGSLAATGLGPGSEPESGLPGRHGGGRGGGLRRAATIMMPLAGRVPAAVPLGPVRRDPAHWQASQGQPKRGAAPRGQGGASFRAGLPRQ